MSGLEASWAQGKEKLMRKLCLSLRLKPMCLRCGFYSSFTHECPHFIYQL